jgi:hypothetical protein
MACKIGVVINLNTKNVWSPSPLVRVGNHLTSTPSTHPHLTHLIICWVVGFLEIELECLGLFFFLGGFFPSILVFFLQ